MKKYIIYSLLLSLFLCSCKKNELGGKAEIKGQVKHHTKVIANATVYIKFNAKEFPGTDVSLYNDKVTADANGNYTIKCYKGDYYLYAVGTDVDVPPPSIVKGGAPISVRNKEVVEAELAVTE
ncbi:MAG: hypothetical protein H0W73_17855 [Bacteroidetes bacterium]|nr:hypothetical protein [Bacteroidota bacterium]